MVWVRKIVAEVSLPPQSQNASHRTRGIHRTFCREESPTDFTDRHRWLGCEDSSGGILASAAAKCLPQNTQNSQNLLQRRFSHRFHGLTQMVWVRKIVAEVSLPPQSQNASHRTRRIHRTFCWGCSPTEHAEFTEPANFRGCTCLKCTNVTRGISILLGWCTSCLVGALETSAPP